MRWRLEQGEIGLTLACVLLAAVGCGSKTDDEIWLQRIHSSPTYAYAALKILIADPNRDEDVRRTRKLFDELAAAPPLSAKPDPIQVAQQTFTFGRALWKLRDLGKTEVGKLRESKLLLFSAQTVAEPGQAAQGQAALPEPLWTPQTEHGALLLLLLLSKLDDRAPTPVPPEVLLYEAYMTGPAPLPDALLANLVTSSQATVTAAAELCDVAGRFTDQLARAQVSVDQGAARSLLVGALAASGAKGDVAEAIWIRTLLDALPWGMRLLAHGRTALCFDGRKQPDKARIEWERAVALGSQAGIPEADLALVQAYAAYRAQDWPQTRVHLQHGSSSSLLSPDEREKVRQMAERFDEKDPSTVESLFDRAFVTRTLLGMVDQRLRRAGVYARLLEQPSVVALRRAVESLSQANLELNSAGLWQRVTSLWSNADAPNTP